MPTPQPIYQPIPEADLERFMDVEAHAFTSPLADVRRWLAERHTGDLRGLYHEGELVSQAMLFRFAVQAGATTLPCGGLGSVATPPEHRRRGWIGHLLRGACDELRAEGTALCILFPFKTSFYSRYGWAPAMERKIYTGSPDTFARFRAGLTGRFVPAGPADVPELDAIYTASLRGRFGPVVRTQAWWEKEVLDTAGKQVYTYIWRDAQGNGRSYLVYRFERGPAGNRLVCREIVARDAEARAQLFGFLANHDAQCDEVLFRAPSDAPVNLLMSDPLTCTVEPYGMLRLIDVAGALNAQRYPSARNGRLTIQISDDWLEHNNGVFELEIAHGAAQCQKLPDGAEADLACDVRTLTLLYTRLLRPRTAAAFGQLEARRRESLGFAEALFGGLAPFFSDYF